MKILIGLVGIIMTINAYALVGEANLSNEQINDLYDSIDIEGVDTGIDWHYKIVGSMIILKSLDFHIRDSRIFLKHPCQSVFSKKEATQCMKFWAKEIEPSYNLDNKSYVVTSTKLRKMHAKKMLKLQEKPWRSGSEDQVEDVENSDYLGMMARYEDDDCFIYFTIQNGKNVTPVRVWGNSIGDFVYYDLAEIIQSQPEEEMETFTADMLKMFFLDSSPNRFPIIRDLLINNIVETHREENGI